MQLAKLLQGRELTRDATVEAVIEHTGEALQRCDVAKRGRDGPNKIVEREVQLLQAKRQVSR